MTKKTLTEPVLYLTFKIGSELLAIAVSRVREVLDLCPITRVPRTPEFIRGVINLRGTVIPVVDVRLKFGLTQTDATIDARIIVIEQVREGAETRIVGLLTDSVHDVIEINADDIDSSPLMGSSWRTEFIHGVGRYGDQFVLLLDIDRLFSDRNPDKETEHP